MPNYNCEKYLAEAIESILNQSFTDFEFIIVDDCSTDNSWGIIQGYAKQDKRIVAMRNEENLKICKTLNRGLEIAKGEYIARMDSDDVAKNIWIETVFEKIGSDKNIWVCGSNFDVINEAWEKTSSKSFPETDTECKNAIWFRNPFAHNTVLIRKSVLDDVGYYNPDFVYAEDLELWIRIWAKYKLYNIQQNLVHYRVFFGNSIIKRQKLMIQNTLRARKLARKLWYKTSLKWRFYYFGTWCMQFLPPRFVLWLFNKVT